ncbi:MAG: aquaporin [Ignavibacteriae bacterium]|nr:aquaporin [Ignavibacteriota bacterium]
MNKYFSEYLGTFFLVFAGTGAIVINDVSGGAITHLGIALTFGLIVMVMIYALGDISGAHFNPAVSVGFWIAKRLPSKELFFFILSQIAGALTASIFLKIVFPQHETVGTTLPQHISAGSDFILEMILTFLLMFVIIHVSEGSKEKGLMAGIAIGGTVGLEAIFAGPVTGASMNPARSFAPAIISGHLECLWVYLTAPFLGAALAIFSCCFLKQGACCRLKS